MRSLHARVSALVLSMIVLVLVPLGVFSYLKMIGEVDELGDARLAQNARTIEALAQTAGSHWTLGDEPTEVANFHGAHGEPEFSVHGHNYETQIGFQYWGADNVLHLTSRNFRNITVDAAPAGFADIVIDGRQWRVFTRYGAEHDWVRVGERYESRHEIARALAIENLLPLLVGAPLLLVAAGWAVRRGLRPLRVLSERIVQRRDEDSGPIGFFGIPREVEPVVAATNDLLRRQRAQLDQERLAAQTDAHELRSLLDAVATKIDHVQAQAAMPALTQAQEELRKMARILERKSAAAADLSPPQSS